MVFQPTFTGNSLGVFRLVNLVLVGTHRHYLDLSWMVFIFVLGTLHGSISWRLVLGPSRVLFVRVCCRSSGVKGLI